MTAATMTGSDDDVGYSGGGDGSGGDDGGDRGNDNGGKCGYWAASGC